MLSHNKTEQKTKQNKKQKTKNKKNITKQKKTFIIYTESNPLNKQDLISSAVKTLLIDDKKMNEERKKERKKERKNERK